MRSQVSYLVDQPSLLLSMEARTSLSNLPADPLPLTWCTQRACTNARHSTHGITFL